MQLHNLSLKHTLHSGQLCKNDIWLDNNIPDMLTYQVFLGLAFVDLMSLCRKAVCGLRCDRTESLLSWLSEISPAEKQTQI